MKYLSSLVLTYLIATVTPTLAEPPSTLHAPQPSAKQSWSVTKEARAKVSPPSRRPITKRCTWKIEDLRIFCGENPIFPIGLYFVSHQPSERARRALLLEDMARLPINMLATPVAVGDRPFLRRLAAEGIWLTAEFNGEPQDVLPQISDSPSLAFLIGHDDIDKLLPDGKQRTTPVEATRRLGLLKGLDKQALVFSTGAYPDRITAYQNAADVMALQVYPMPSEPAGEVFNRLSTIRRSFATGTPPTPLIGILQTYATRNYPGPTATEILGMTAQAIVAGVQGVYFYTYFDGLTSMQSAPHLRDGIAKSSRLLANLSDYLVGGYEELPSTNPHIRAARWTRPGKDPATPGGAIIIASNLERSPQSAAITIDGDTSRVALDPLDYTILERRDN
jgi:hypothetical protein